MPRSVNIHPDHKQTVEKALQRNGFLTQGDLAAYLDGMALSTVNNFFNAKKVYISTFEKICEALDLDKRVIQQPLAFDQEVEVKEKLEFSSQFSKYNAQTWVGREQLIEDLSTKLLGNTRIVWLTGLSGIGKTTLGECIAVKAWESNTSFRWMHFETTESQLSDFATGARAILSELGEKDLNSETINDPKWLSDRLLTKLQENCYWLQIDALEKLIEINEFIDENWLIFFKNCLTANYFPSRLFLTSQVLPNAMISWQDDYRNVWSEHKLKGLKPEESEQYFIKNGILVNESHQNFLNNISQIYEGHPLVLQVITKEIVQDYQGDVVKYWEHNKAEFEQVCRELNSHRLTEIQYNEALARRVRERVKKSLEQLPETAIALLCRSSVYRRPVLKSFWLGLITEFSNQEQNEAYRILGDRALVEKEKILIRLHNLVRDIAYDWLREDVVIWKETEIKAAELWLREYKPEKNTENLEKVRGYLEAFYHYCNIQDWEKAKNILFTTLNTSEKAKIYWQLGIWGYYEEQVKICMLMLEKLDNQVDITWLNTLSSAYQNLGQYQQAIHSSQKQLDIANIINDDQGKGYALGDFGRIFRDQGKYDDASIYFQDALMLLEKIDDKWGKCSIFGHWGLNYFYSGQFQQAIDYYEKYLELAHQTNNNRAESDALINLGYAYCNLADYNKAVENLKKALSIADKIDDLKCQGLALGNLGITFGHLEKYEEALENLLLALGIFKKIKARSLMAKANKHLAVLYYKNNNQKLARQHCQNALLIASELGIPLATELNVHLTQECQELLSKIEEAETNEV